MNTDPNRSEQAASADQAVAHYGGRVASFREQAAAAARRDQGAYASWLLWNANVLSRALTAEASAPWSIDQDAGR